MEQMEQNVAQTETNTEPTIDYEVEYKKAIAERDNARAEAKKYESLKDKYSRESADYKRQLEAQMTDEQKREAENAEKEQRYQQAMARVAEMETTTLFAENGFDKKDYGEIAAKIVEISGGGDKAKEFTNTLIAFVKKANQSAVASARNGAIKDGAVPPKTSTAQASDTPFAEQAFAYTKHDDRSQEIKNKYRK